MNIERRPEMGPVYDKNGAVEGDIDYRMDIARILGKVVGAGKVGRGLLVAFLLLTTMGIPGASAQEPFTGSARDHVYRERQGQIDPRLLQGNPTWPGYLSFEERGPRRFRRVTP